MTGRSASRSGSRAPHGAADASPPEASIPSAARFAEAINLLAEVREAATSVLCESNGLFDNEYSRVRRGKAVWELRWPVKGYGKTLDSLGDALSRVSTFLEPEEAAKHAKWSEACNTASAIVRLFEEGLEGKTHPNLVKSSLHRNIADAINGTLKATRRGKLSDTMDDLLAALVAKGELIPLTASAIEAPSGGETGNTDSTEGESAVPNGETPS